MEEVWSKENSILSDIRKLLGPGEDYTAFDRDIAMHINSAFARLCQLGVGPTDPFHIETGTEKWSDFDTDADMYQIQRYIYLYVKVIFDPSANATIAQAYQNEIDKMEWLMNSVSEVGY